MHNDQKSIKHTEQVRDLHKVLT